MAAGIALIQHHQQGRAREDVDVSVHQAAHGRVGQPVNPLAFPPGADHGNVDAFQIRVAVITLSHRPDEVAEVLNVERTAVIHHPFPVHPCVGNPGPIITDELPVPVRHILGLALRTVRANAKHQRLAATLRNRHGFINQIPAVNILFRLYVTPIDAKIGNRGSRMVHVRPRTGIGLIDNREPLGPLLSLIERIPVKPLERCETDARVNKDIVDQLRPNNSSFPVHITSSLSSCSSSTPFQYNEHTRFPSPQTMS